MFRDRNFITGSILVIVVACGLQFTSGKLSGEVYAAPSSPQSETADAVIAASRADNRAMAHIEHLVNKIGTRPADTLAYLEACWWVRDELRRFGLANVHLERVGEIEGYFPEDEAAAQYQLLHRKLFGEKADLARIPIVNVVADIPGTEWPDEYVILGGHLDSTPQGDGALDNGTGVAAIMETARLLVEAQVQPRRTIRFILFGGEEVGLRGSRGYVEAHPDLMLKISAVYIMDRGTAYVSGLKATSPLENDLRQAFTAADGLDPELSFAVDSVDYLPAAVDCGGTAVVAGPDEAAKMRAAGGCGSARGAAAGSSCSPARNASNLKAGSVCRGDTLIEQVVIAGSGAPVKDVTLESLGLTVEELTAKIRDGEFKRAVALGSSDHAPFLQAGVPAFFLQQNNTPEVPYPAHTGTLCPGTGSRYPRYSEPGQPAVARTTDGTGGRPVSTRRLTGMD